MKPKYRITIVPDGVLNDGYDYVVNHWKNDDGTPIYGGRILSIPHDNPNYISCIGYRTLGRYEYCKKYNSKNTESLVPDWYMVAQYRGLI